MIIIFTMLSLTIFQSQIWGLIFPVQVPCTWGTWCGISFFSFSMFVVFLPLGLVFWELGSWLYFSPSYHFWCGLHSRINCGQSVLLVLVISELHGCGCYLDVSLRQRELCILITIFHSWSLIDVIKVL